MAPDSVTDPNLPHRCRIHGLEIASRLALPELAPGGGEPDVEVRVGDVPRALSHVTGSGLHWQAATGEFLFHVVGVARYHVVDGRRIVVEPAEADDDKSADIRLYLLGTAMGALLHQRGLLALHASAVATPTGTWAFTGHSGAGKSTLAAWLQQRQGWPSLSDDVIVLDDSGSEPRLQPGPPRVKLWRDALEAMSIAQDGLTRDLMRFDKFHLTTDPASFHSPLPFRALVLIEAAETGETASLTPLRGRDALAVIMASVYRPELAAWLRQPGDLFLQCSRLARQIVVYRFRRPRSLENFDEALQPLLARINAG